MPAVFWCDANRSDACNFEHVTICTDACASGPTHSFGGGRALKARDDFDGPPERGGLSRPPDSMDAWKQATAWFDGRNKLLVNDGRSTAWDMHPCYNVVQRRDEVPCPAQPGDCLGGHDDWRRNCGHRVESSSDMIAQHCEPSRDAEGCPARMWPVQFRADGFTGRTTFVGGAGMSGECIGNLNWWCFGTTREDGRCTSTVEARRWNVCRMDWRQCDLAQPVRNEYSPPAIEHDLRAAALRYVVNNAAALGIANINRPPDSSMGTIDRWEATWNLVPPPVECGDLPFVATLPGARLEQAGCDVDASLVLFGVRAWMSLHMRREDQYTGFGTPRTTYPATAQIGLDIDLGVRATVDGGCSTAIPDPCTPRGANGESIIYASGNGHYRPPYRVQWRGEATPKTEPLQLTAAVEGNQSGQIDNDSANGVCNNLRIGLGGQKIEAKSIAKGTPEEQRVERWGGFARILRIGD